MKIRVGFVSNSSSTAFLVGFKEIPKNFCELEEMFWGEGIGTGGWYHDSSVYDMAAMAFSLMKKSVDSNGNIMDPLRARGLIDPWDEKKHSDFDSLMEKWEEIFHDTHVVYIEVSDETHVGSDLGAFMERLERLKKVPCWWISKH